MWRQDIAEEKQAQLRMARGCLCLSINAKQTTSLGKEDISLFISFLSFFLFFSSWAHINFESRGEEKGAQGMRAKKKKQTEKDGQGRKGQGKKSR